MIEMMLNIEDVALAFQAKFMPCSIGPLAPRIGGSGPHQLYESIFYLEAMEFHDYNDLNEQKYSS
jgi:hypothetical protein